MDDLPTELLDAIVWYCGHAERKALRSVNQRFHHAATPYVFEHFYMSFNVSDLSKLAALSNSHLAERVHSFTLRQMRVPEYVGPAVWRGQIDLRPTFSEWLAQESLDCLKCKVMFFDEYCDKITCPWPAAFQSERESLIGRACAFHTEIYTNLPRCALGEEEIREYWRTFEDARNQHKSWKQSPPRLALREYLSRLPNLEYASVLTFPGYAWRTDPFCERFEQHTLFRPRDWLRQSICDFEASQAMQAPPSLLRAISFRNGFFGTKPLKKLEILMDSMNEDQWSLDSSARRHAESSGICDAFKHLEELTWHYIYDDKHSPSERPREIKQIVACLTPVSQLRSLHLTFCGLAEHSFLEDQIPLFHGERTVWPKLAKLSLTTTLSSKGFRLFLRAHASTIRSLELRYCSIDDAGVLIEMIPKVLRLEHVYLQCLCEVVFFDTGVNWPWPVLPRGSDFDAPQAQEVKAYLLGKQATMPEIEGLRGPLPP